MAQPISVFLPPLKGEVGGEAARRGQFRYKIKAKKIAVLEPLSQCCALPAPLSGEPKNKRHRAGTKIIPYHCPEKADPTERSWRGVLRGHVPSKSLSADSEIPRAHTSGHRSKVGEKSDSFSRAERTRPLRPVCRLLCLDFENVPVERFQRILPLLKLADTARRVPTKDWFILSWISLTSSTILNRSASARCDLF